MSVLERVSVTVERDLLERFDQLIARSKHQNRSEAVRDLIRSRLVEEEVSTSHGELMGTVTLVYDHTQRELSDRLLAAGHHHEHVTLSTLHVHVDAVHCLEVTVLRGEAQELKRVAAHLLGMKGVKHGKLVLTSVAL
jgi:CopG family nickel-responsive transcriptional regulator